MSSENSNIFFETFSQPFNESLSEILLQKNNVADTIKERARGRDKDYLSSVRCQQCSGRPVSMKQENQPVCSSCGEMVDQETISEYHEVKEAVEKVINMERIPADAAPQGRFKKKCWKIFSKIA